MLRDYSFWLIQLGVTVIDTFEIFQLQQMSRSMDTHAQNQGYHPSKEELNGSIMITDILNISDRTASFANKVRCEGTTL